MTAGRPRKGELSPATRRALQRQLDTEVAALKADRRRRVIEAGIAAYLHMGAKHVLAGLRREFADPATSPEKRAEIGQLLQSLKPDTTP
jgi:hypothetical protein